MYVTELFTHDVIIIKYNIVFIMSVICNQMRQLPVFNDIFYRHIVGHFGDESFQAITSTGTDNSTQAGKIHQNTQNKQTGPR